MKRQLKIAGVIVIALSLFLSAANFTFAEGSVKTVNMNEISTPTQQEVERSLAEIPFIPSGYTAKNIFALSMAIEQVNNPRASMILQRNIDLAIAKWEEEQALKEQRQKQWAAEKRKKDLAAKAKANAKAKKLVAAKKKTSENKKEEKKVEFEKDQKPVKASTVEAEKAKEEAEKAKEKAEEEAERAKEKAKKEEEKKRKDKRDEDDDDHDDEKEEDENEDEPDEEDGGE